ncbi:MAG: hypothetical protein KA158_00385 [Leucobacter sp.]|nr:hypothetical protein [Leucobacter sp.]
MIRPWSLAAARQRLVFAGRALRGWSSRQYLIAALVAAGFALLVGVVTVLIPNPWFARDIDTVWWNYPVWALTAIGVGLLTATYVKSGAAPVAGPEEEPSERRTTRMGIAGGVLTWFAVGCPVCNKIALIALGYSGAITWFAPLQPVLAIAALILTGLALVWRLSGQVACPVPTKRPTAKAAEMETNR